MKLCPLGFTSGPQLLNLSLENWVDLSSVQACLPCHSACLTCSGPGPTDCLSCPPHSHLVLSSCLYQNQVQRKSPSAGGLKKEKGPELQEQVPASDSDSRDSGSSPLLTVVALLSCALILAAFAGLFLLLQKRSGCPATGLRTTLPPVYSHSRGIRLGFHHSQHTQRNARICYKGIPTVWGDEDMITYESESDSEDVEGHSERTAFIKTQSSI